MTESVLRIQEVCDELAYHISDSVDLKSTALVSHTLCISAQRQLFRHIALDPMYFPHNGADPLSVVFSNAQSKVEAAAQRLSAILVAKPHLLGCVRHLTVCTPPVVVELIANFQFPMLQKLSLVFDYSAPEEATLRCFRDLLASPLLREVEVSYVDLEDNPFTPFASLFETCSPRLESLAFNQIAFPSSIPTTSEPRQSRPQIKTLKLDDATNCGDWFMSSSCPFDFTHLRDVDVVAGDEQRDESLLLFLTSVRLSLTRLVFSNAPDIDLSEFPALTHLGINPAYGLSPLLPNNRVETLVFYLNLFRFEGGHGGQRYLAADKFVAEAQMPALRQVEVCVSGNGTFDQEVVEAHFPQLVAKGLVTVVNCTFPPSE
ncbi:hypothetical protein B0H11DRAFT_2298235 [Mycena galericulata]|nr:hypothetical protein B0H11DRAFT_2298235 [Mycena galericulata]